jgi:succinate dehydrogenase/fumarate reductase-like Fe-S protein
MSGFEEIEVEIRLWRQPADAAAGHWEDHRITIPRGDHVLNLLAAFRARVDPSLCYPDHFCKIGTCGACALVVDGRPVLGCRALVRATRIEIAPPRGRRILADLLAEAPDKGED